ncbi:MAG TPA: SDR family NAD(P)-dependent oxidoreductase [Solirubrobacteraceae bacterium]|nr:SDR family NAD(P)-dependent oxidoreductase [Solirubrobacteraceae bacterium]
MRIGSGTRALVTGASRGIGRALAHELAARGATVGLAARSVSDLRAVADELPGAHHVLVCDVALRESVTAAVEEFVAAAGGMTCWSSTRASRTTSRSRASRSRRSST